jgi:UDP-N-acetylmuramoyl-L-alanyl-D-glutamate--2,6-diaminopimelate ligase
MMPLESPAAGSRGATVGELVRALSSLGPVLLGSHSTRVTGVRHDSRSVEAGDLFVARRGANSDGASFVLDAARRGASALVAEHETELPALEIPVIRVRDARRALSVAAESVYGHPSQALGVIGITGTNGKTTTALLVSAALEKLGARPATLGTLGFSFDGKLDEGSHTTPEADDVSRRLAEVRERGGTHFVMEVSSHALSQERVAALRFEVAAFTNLSQDHLDYHGDMERYGAEKARLFTELAPRHSVIQIGDPFGRALAARIAGRKLTVARSGEADLVAKSSRIDASGIQAELDFRGEALSLSSSLVGEHNLENLLVALGILIALGFPARDAVQALERAPAAPGRLERCDVPGDDLVVVVDYAHTPDALERVLAALRPITRNRLWCVFGCGGDRDPGKRPKMGRAVAEAADRAIVTNDNPRSEAPEAIARAIVPPLEASGIEYRVILDRAEAIERAVLEAAAGDSILIAGKGHETYQIFGAERAHFDDREQARRALELRRGRA